ncbi:MAG: hypothetical protein JRI61_09905, partial [Deltaproteobacteria bacterium]|nr:hypothetical protein [Deltaproteobacteria bacterium]
MIKKKKKIFAACIVCVVLLFLCLFGARIYLETDHARLFVMTAINKNIPGTISWSENRFSFFRGGIDLTNVLLKGPTCDHLIALERVRMNISWLDLMTGSLTVESAFLEKPQVFLEEEEDGTLNLLKAFGGDEDSSGVGIPFNIIIRKALINGGSMRYDLNAHDRIVIPAIDLELRHGNLFKQKANLFLRLTNSEFSMGER